MNVEKKDKKNSKICCIFFKNVVQSKMIVNFWGLDRKKLFTKLFDKTFLKFIVVGIINIVFGTTIMFFCF